MLSDDELRALADALAQVREALANEALFDPGASTADTYSACKAFGTACTPENMRAILAHVEAQAAEIERLRDFADLWYFIMDEAPRDFERIVAEYQPKAWLEQAAKLRRAKKEKR